MKLKNNMYGIYHPLGYPKTWAAYQREEKIEQRNKGIVAAVLTFILIVAFINS